MGKTYTKLNVFIVNKLNLTKEIINCYLRCSQIANHFQDLRKAYLTTHLHFTYVSMHSIYALIPYVNDTTFPAINLMCVKQCV